jgi:hypothetical protein
MLNLGHLSLSHLQKKKEVLGGHKNLLFHAWLHYHVFFIQFVIVVDYQILILPILFP